MVTMAVMVRNTCAGADRHFVLRKSVGWSSPPWRTCLSARRPLNGKCLRGYLRRKRIRTMLGWCLRCRKVRLDYPVHTSVSIEAKGDRLRVNADYALQNLVYANDSSHNNFYHQLNANANATLVDNTLFLDASGGISQQATSLLGPLSIKTLTRQRYRRVELQR